MSKPFTLDQNTTLCLACSSSLPPVRRLEEYIHRLKRLGIHITPCCQKPICSVCVKANPRLARYDPCLACLGGVDAVRSPTRDVKNLDGAVKDEDIFIVGDDEDPPQVDPTPTSDVLSGAPEQSRASDKAATGTNSPSIYYLNKRDTLQGIAFRFAADGRELCRLNKLPITTLSTTPHLLHTRSYIMLPPSTRSISEPYLTDEEAREKDATRVKERAERRLQTLLKEVDPRVAKAYVALADDEEQREAFRRKVKEGFGGYTNGPDSSLEATAIEQYLEDEEWERRQGRTPAF